jgi:Ca-activated chloride channel family protein
MAADVVQGGLKLTMPGLKLAQSAPVAVVREANHPEDILHVQNFNTTVTYIVGTYDLDILTLPRIRQRITLKPGTTQEITIPPSGEVTIQLKSPGYGAIFAIDGNNWIWVTNLDEFQTRQQYSLQPGTYKVIYRPRTAQQTTYSKTNTFTIAPGSSTLVRIP